MAKYASKDIICAKMMHCNFRSPDMTVSDFINDELPSADVQLVKRGEWEKKSSVGVFRCSLCQHIFMLGADEIDEYHFCPNCGADMRTE